jgi:hypothetical protein
MRGGGARRTHLLEFCLACLRRRQTTAAMGGEPSVEELLHTHNAKLQAMRAKLGAKLEQEVGTLLDDLWLLRFLLSHDGDVDEATTAADDTLAWRLKNADMLRAAKEQTSPGDYYDTVRTYVVVRPHHPPPSVL